MSERRVENTAAVVLADPGDGLFMAGNAAGHENLCVLAQTVDVLDGSLWNLRGWKTVNQHRHIRGKDNSGRAVGSGGRHDRHPSGHGQCEDAE